VSAPAPVFFGEVRDGHIHWPVSERQRIADMLKRLHGQRVQMTLALPRRSRSLEQNRWRVVLDDDSSLDVDAVIVASGGLSVPKTGSDGFGLQLARKLGHSIHKTYPALTPLTAEPSAYTELAGVSLSVTLTAQSAERSAKATGGFLFTHRGYSGPAVLDVSHVAVRSRAHGAELARLTVRWSARSADDWLRALRRSGNRSVIGVLREGLIIFAWVVMWRPVDMLIYDWIPLRRERRVLSRLRSAPVEVRTGKGPPRVTPATTHRDAAVT
jgi:predicted flavoprotein YhiN